MKSYKQVIEKMTDTERSIIISNAEREGRFHGNENRPKSNEDIAPYVETAFQSSAVLYHSIRNVIGNAVVHFTNVAEGSKATIEGLQRERNEFRKRRNHLENVKSVGYTVNALLVMTMILLLLLSAETYFNSKAFQIFGLGLPSSIAMGCGFSLAVLILAHVALRTLAFARNALEVRLIIVSWILFFTALFFFLGEYRNAYLDAIGGGYHVSIFSFILFNWLFLIAGAVVLSKFPSIAELKIIVDEALAIWRIDRLDRKVRAIEKEIAEQESILIAASQELRNMPWYEDSERKLVESIAKEARSRFVSENLKARTDGYAPYATYDTDSNSSFNPLIK